MGVLDGEDDRTALTAFHGELPERLERARRDEIGAEKLNRPTLVLHAEQVQDKPAWERLQKRSARWGLSRRLYGYLHGSSKGKESA